MSKKFPKSMAALAGYLKKLSGVGAKTAERFAFEFLKWDEESLKGISILLHNLKTSAPLCAECGCLSDEGECHFCKAPDSHALCIIASPRDAYAIESTHTYRGLYHVIEHLLSPLDGRTAQTLRIDRIEKRIEEHGITEVIIALDSTLDADATALYLKQALARPNLSISRLAFGLPVGSSLEYIDSGTLARALVGRQSFAK
jgi:recombination protein RecR